MTAETLGPLSHLLTDRGTCPVILPTSPSTPTLPTRRQRRQHPERLDSAFNKEEEPLGLAGFEQLPRAKPDSSSPVGFGKEEDLVLSQSTHTVGEPDIKCCSHY